MRVARWDLSRMVKEIEAILAGNACCVCGQESSGTMLPVAAELVKHELCQP
jgi:hypothetical protein